MGIFRSPERAAINFAQRYNDNSIKDKLEYGATLYRVDLKNGNKFYTYSVPNVGGAENGVIPQITNIKNATLIGALHTHSNYSKKYLNDDFSDADYSGANFSGYNAYLATPSGEVLKYDVITLQTTRIHKSVPFDSNHPAKKGVPQNNNLPKNEPTRGWFKL